MSHDHEHRYSSSSLLAQDGTDRSRSERFPGSDRDFTAVSLFGTVDAIDNGSGSKLEFSQFTQFEDRNGSSKAAAILKARTDDLVGQSVIMKAYMIRPMDTVSTSDKLNSNSDARIDGEYVYVSTEFRSRLKSRTCTYSVHQLHDSAIPHVTPLQNLAKMKMKSSTRLQAGLSGWWCGVCGPFAIQSSCACANAMVLISPP